MAISHWGSNHSFMDPLLLLPSVPHRHTSSLCGKIQGERALSKESRYVEEEEGATCRRKNAGRRMDRVWGGGRKNGGGRMTRCDGEGDEKTATGGIRRCDGEGRAESYLVALRRRQFVVLSPSSALSCLISVKPPKSDINKARPMLLHPTNRLVRRPPLSSHPSSAPALPSPFRPTILLLLPSIRQFNAFRQF